MKKKITRLLKLAFCSLGLGTALTAQAGYNPISLTGFTADIIANGTGAVSATTTADIDGTGTGYCLMAQNYVGPTGQVPNNATYPALENSGLITSAITTTPGLTFQFASYSANNALRLVGAGATGTLTLATPQSAGELYVLGTSGNATSSLTITVTFADATTQVFTSQSIADWFATGQTNVARQNLGRVSRADNTVQYTSTPVGPRLYQVRLALLPANYGKLINSITFLKPLLAGNAMILAVSANSACSGTPTAGTTVANVTTACTGSSVALSLSGASTDIGISYQWQSSTDGGTTFNNISGATSATYTTTSQTVATQYQAILTCSTSGLTGTSTPVSVAQSSFLNCYCAPVSTGTGEYINSVAINTLSNATNANSTSGLGDFTGNAALTTTLNQGSVYPVALGVHANSNGSQGGMWIDYNHSGTFEASEYTALGGSNASNSNVTINGSVSIPVGALLGQTRLRVRWRNGSIAATDACTTGATTWYGETEDYLITIAASSVCTGTPLAGTAAASTGSACVGTSLSLSDTGYTLGVTGISFQWQSSPAGANTFTSLGTAQATPNYAVTSQTASTDYRVVVTCAASGLSATSNIVTVTTTYLTCYCAPVSGPAGEYINSVAINTLSNATNAASANGYGDFTGNAALTTTLNQASVYPVALGVHANNGGSQGGMWIDYNHSGTFEASEYTPIGGSSASNSNVTINGSVSIPATALLGQTRLRVRWRNSSIAATDACTSGPTTWYGETEDYLITIAASSVCTGTPTAGTATATVGSTCVGTSFTLSATGYTSGVTGISFQWQSSPAGANTFTSLGSAQASANYTVPTQTLSTDYRVVVTCTGSGLSATSTPVTVTQNSFLTCYCTPTYATGGTTDNVVRVQLGTLDNASTGNASPYYRDYTTQQTGATPTLPTPTIFPGTNAVVTVTFGSDPNQHGAVWIDFNQNGILGDVANEFVATTASAGANGVKVFTLPVPAGAALGITKMRIRGGDDTNDPTLGQACGASGSSYGEGEDYLVNVVAPTACTGAPAATTATSTVSSGCSGTSFTLSATGIVAGTTGLTYQWQSSPAGANTFANLGAVQTTLNYAVTGQTASTDYQVVVTCTASGQSTTSSIVTVTTTFLNCYCAVVSGAGGEYIKGVTFPGVNGFTNTTNAASANGTGDFTGNAALTTTLNQGATYLNGVSVTVHSNNTNSQGGMWIDYNHSGTFDASEYTLIGTSNAINTDVIFPVTLVVPGTALLGQTRVRVRWRNGGFAATDACVTGATTWYGETEDYLITIVAPATCTAPPATITATADVASACANSSFNLSTNSIPSTIGGFTYQWQSRTGINAFADIAGATTNPYNIASQTAATDYQLVVSCQYGGVPVTSNVVSVGQNAFDQCYCTTSSTNGCSQYGSITNVAIGTLNNASTCAASTYTVFPATGTATTDLTPGTSATLTLTVGNATATFPFYYGVWIDFNHNGTFDASEFVAGLTTTVSTTTTTATIAIPALSATVLGGPTRMRVRTNAGIISYGPFNSGQGCTVTYNGETEDYTVNLTAAPDLMVTTTTGIPAGTYNNVTITGSGNGTLAGTTVVNGNFYVLPGGTLNTACQPLTGAGTFAMAAGATLNICSPQGITLSGATGAVQTTTRRYATAGNYIYSGSAAQVTGAGLPAQVRNLTVSTSGGATLTLSQPVAIRRLLTLTSGNVLSGQNLTLRSDADSTALVSVGPGGGTVSGSATVQRYISAATNAGPGYRHFAAPVANTTVADLANGSFSPSVSQGAAYNASATPGLVTPFPNIFGYDEARQATSPATGYSVFDRGWVAPTSTSDPLTPGKGYTVNLAGGQMVDFVGTLGTGTVATPLTRGTTADAGWNLVGNPYPSTLNWDNVTIPTGMDAAVYVYRSAGQYTGSYSSYANGLGTGNSRSATIAMGQGFFVRATANTTLTFTDAARSADFSSNGAFLRGSDPRPRVRLALENAGATLTDAAYVYFEAGATTGVDALYDAVKLPNPTGLGIAAVAAGTPLAINGLPTLTTTTVPLTVDVPQAGTFTLRAEELANLTGTPVYLNDALTGQQIDLSQQPTYTFTATGAAQIAGRFSLGFAPAGPLATQAGLSAASVSIFPNPAHASFTVLVPAVPGAKQVQLTLLNSLGQRVSEQQAALGTTGAQATVNVSGLAAGIYTLRLQVAGQAAVARRVVVE